MTITDPTTVSVLGEQVAIPVEVRSATSFGGTFTAPYSAARDLIAYSGLRPVKVAGALTICMVTAVQYTDNDLGPYNEIALAIVVEPHDGGGGGGMATGEVTTLIHRLPVNQEFTCAAGRDIWGFPKWVADLSYTCRQGRREMVMLDDDELAVALSVDTRLGIPLPDREMEMTCYSYRDGVLRVTPWTMRMHETRMRPGGVRLEVGRDNQLADDLATLGFPKRALGSQVVGHLSCTFGEARVVT